MNQKIDSAYIFDTDENGVPTFSKKNIAFLNGILRYDSNYSSVLNQDNPEYAASYAGLLENSEFFSSFGTPISDETDNCGNPIDILYKVIESIDRSNSTHLASEGNGKKKTKGETRNKGRALVAEKIREIGGKNLKRRLEECDNNLVMEIAAAEVGGKRNFSFASKFCAYVSRHALGKDNFCIYDEIVQSVLPYYAWMYVDESTRKDKFPNIYKTVKGKNRRNESLVYKYKSKGSKDGYAAYRNLIDEIIAGIKRKNDEQITYEDFDRLIWYYFKGTKGRVLDAMKVLPEINKIK